ncbi:MAG: hypothetical protein LM583_04810 [Desulfurococcaceae archaeon]|nr:hypothetical protein [Desulfurococcaceae archaeon]
MLCEEFDRGRGRASKVLELSIELVEKLSSLNVLRLGLDTERALYIAALLHGIGVCWSADNSHREYTYRALLTHEKELNSTCGCDLTKKVADIAKLHGAADPISIDMDSETKATIGIIRIAEVLDYTLNQTVEEIDTELKSNKIKLRVLCRGRWSCRTGVAKTLKKKTLLEEVLGLKIQIEEAVK